MATRMLLLLCVTGDAGLPSDLTTVYLHCLTALPPLVCLLAWVNVSYCKEYCIVIGKVLYARYCEGLCFALGLKTS